MSVWVAITIHLLCTSINEEGGDEESTDSEAPSLLSYTLRFVRIHLSEGTLTCDVHMEATSTLLMTGQSVGKAGSVSGEQGGKLLP